MAAMTVIAVPAGIETFPWTASMWGGSIQSRAPMLTPVGSIFLFTVGGVTAVVLANGAGQFAAGPATL
jgi:cytochrome c oxidase subunit 1